MPTPSPSLPAGFLKLLLALVLALATYALIVHQERSYEDILNQNAKPSAALKNIPGTVQDFEKALEGMKTTNDLLINWAIVLLGGTITIAIMGKGAKIRDRNWGLVWIPLTWVIIASSLVNASRFKGKLTYQLAHGTYLFRELNLYLFLQVYFFKWSLVALLLIATWYLFFRFSLLEERKGGDDADT